MEVAEPKPSPKQQQREARRAAAMRENLRKRKAQAAERAVTAESIEKEPT